MTLDIHISSCWERNCELLQSFTYFFQSSRKLRTGLQNVMSWLYFTTFGHRHCALLTYFRYIRKVRKNLELKYKMSCFAHFTIFGHRNCENCELLANCRYFLQSSRTSRDGLQNDLFWLHVYISQGLHVDLCTIAYFHIFLIKFEKIKNS